ncbi:MAG: 4-hydroxythreonine-4-phosphate dehydrogenase PdxA [Thiomargarita sp.]|nr:4-hydroxythreonine-4-phosphate dehydrogenase PdxA [Thiomargarita sp.]
MKIKKPFIAITIGDPAGIGPEVVVKALLKHNLHKLCRPLVVGSKKVIENTLQYCGQTAKINLIQKPWQGAYQNDIIDLIDIDNINLSKLAMGTTQAMCGQAAYDYIEKAVEITLADLSNCMVTAPINKESLRAAEINYIDHTKILANLTKTTKEPVSFIEVKGIRIFFLTHYTSLREACELVTQELVFEHIVRSIEALKNLGITQGTLAVAALNPHNSKNSFYGKEEIDQIEPAIREAQVRGYNVVGPINADIVFNRASQGYYSGVLSLYHDQGYIAAKTLDAEKITLITSGLPFLTTSVEHDTAFDIAGKRFASEINMRQAILTAIEYYSNIN